MIRKLKNCEISMWNFIHKISMRMRKKIQKAISRLGLIIEFCRAFLGFLLPDQTYLIYSHRRCSAAALCRCCSWWKSYEWNSQTQRCRLAAMFWFSWACSMLRDCFECFECWFHNANDINIQQHSMSTSVSLRLSWARDEEMKFCSILKRNSQAE